MLTWTPWTWAWPQRSVHITVQQFRALLPAFADTEKYPDWMIEMQIMAAECKFNPCVWGCQLFLGEAYWIAHNLLVNEMLEQSPLGASSFALSKRVGDTAVTYSESMVLKLAASPNYWTRYGQLYEQLANSLTAGIGIMIV